MIDFETLMNKGKTYRPVKFPEMIHDSIFLCGPCPREKSQSDWRDGFASILRKKGFTGDIINPTNRNWDESDKNMYDKQTSWEQRLMLRSSKVVFWMDRTDENLGFTTNIEFGTWCKYPDSLVVGVSKTSQKSDYIRHECKKNGIPFSETLDDLANLVVKAFSEKENVFFTADTHFGSERTLELSKRPWKTVQEMDDGLISNWNKTITCNDLVYHLGDFGDYEVLNYLNFKELHLIKGNYDRENDPSKSSIVKKYNVIVHDLPIVVNLQGTKEKVVLMHEPISINPSNIEDKKLFCFYAHVHRQNYKRNGINVGVDCAKFFPMSLGEVVFWKDAVQKFYDENVFVDSCIY